MSGFHESLRLEKRNRRRDKQLAFNNENTHAHVHHQVGGDWIYGESDKAGENYGGTGSSTLLGTMTRSCVTPPLQTVGRRSAVGRDVAKQLEAHNASEASKKFEFRKSLQYGPHPRSKQK